MAMSELTDEEMFFGPADQPEAPKQEKQDPYTVIRQSVNDVERRLRVLEERYANLRKKIQITDQNMLDHQSHITKELRVATETVNNLKFQIEEIAEKMAIFNSEFASLAKKRDVKILEKYLDMWQPMNFVTRAEFNQIIGKKE